MITRKVVVNSSMGLHLRPAGILCTKALDYDCRTEFTKGTTRANAKSVLSVLAACVKGGDELELSCDGPDEEAAMEALADLIEHGLEIQGDEGKC